MAAEFRALGGIIENVRLGAGPHGRGLFVVDPARPARIRLPPRLLIAADDVVLEEDRLRIRPGADVDARTRSFFERFEESFSFGAGVRDEGRRILGERHDLPEDVQQHLLANEPPGARRFPPPTDDLILQWFKATRSAAMKLSADQRAAGQKARRVLVPVLELANHSSDYPYFASADGGLEISGHFKDEIFFRYSMTDSWQKFAVWGFASGEPVAYSIPVDISGRDGRILRIRRNVDDYEDLEGFAGPRIVSAGDRLALSHLVLGLRKSPGLPRRLFRRAMAEHGLDEPDELFDAIAHVNRLWFLKLLELLDDHPGRLAAEMRKSARLQLETLSFSIGARDATPPEAIASPESNDEET
jgi:hypothetical protein